MDAPLLAHAPDALASLRRPTATDPLRVLISGCLAGRPCGIDATDDGMGHALGDLVALPTLRIVAFCSWRATAAVAFSSERMPFDHATVALMGCDFAIVLEPEAPDTSAISEQEIAAYHEAHRVDGMPPLATMREHLARAIAAEQLAGRTDPAAALLARFVNEFGRHRIWWDESLTAAANRLGVTPLGAFQVPENRWCDAADGLRTVRALRGFLLDEHRERSDDIACLGLIEETLATAERGGRRWRMLAMW